MGVEQNVLSQVRRLLASNQPSALHVAAAPEAGDPEQMQAQQMRLMALGTRTMALPFGRAALTLGENPCQAALEGKPTGTTPTLSASSQPPFFPLTGRQTPFSPLLLGTGGFLVDAGM